MGKYLIWILIGVIGIAIFVLVWNSMQNNAADMAGDYSSFGDLQVGELDENTPVVVTFEDKTYHRAGCGEIKGSYERFTLKEAKEMGAKPCSICIRKESGK